MHTPVIRNVPNPMSRVWAINDVRNTPGLEVEADRYRTPWACDMGPSARPYLIADVC